MVFQQDNAPSHRAGSTKRLLGEQKLCTVDWPILPVFELYNIIVDLPYDGLYLLKRSTEQCKSKKKLFGDSY